MPAVNAKVRELLDRQAFQMKLMGMTLEEIAKKQRVSIKAVSQRIKRASQTDYVEQVRKRMEIASADAGTVYEKLLRKRGWKKLSDTEKKLQVRVASDVLHGVGALTDEKRIQGDVAVEISIARPPIQSQGGMRAKTGQEQPPLPVSALSAAQEGEKAAEIAESGQKSANIIEIPAEMALEAQKEEKISAEPPELSVGGQPVSEIEKNELTI